MEEKYKPELFGREAVKCMTKQAFFKKRSGNVETNWGCCVIGSYYLNTWRKETEI